MWFTVYLLAKLVALDPVCFVIYFSLPRCLSEIRLVLQGPAVHPSA
jgi:hypothetical protein